MSVLLQPRQTEHSTTEKQKTLKAGPEDFLLEEAAELLRSATFYLERAQQFEWFMKNPHRRPPLVKQDEEVPRPKQGNPGWLNDYYAYYWRQMDKATSYERRAERLVCAQNFKAKIQGGSIMSR